MYVAIRVIAVGLTFACLTAVGMGEDAKVDKADYWPVKEGNKWTYRMETNGQTLELTQALAKVEKKGEHEIGELETTLNGQVIAREQISSSLKGIFRHGFNGMEVDPPVQLLRLPCKKGDKWESEFNVGAEKAKVSCEAGEEDVTVAAGQYHAITVEVDTEIQGQKITAKYWFAPNVGLVKQTFDLAGVAGSMELQKVELTK